MPNEQQPPQYGTGQGQQPQYGGPQQQPQQYGPGPQPPQYGPGAQQPPQQPQPQPQPPQLGAGRKGALGCLGCLVWVLLLGFLALIPGSIVWAVLVEMGKHGSGPFKLDSWVNGSFKNTFGPPAIAFVVGIAGTISVLVQGEGLFNTGRSRSPRQGPPNVRQ